MSVRNPYSRGCKTFLVEVEVGETVEVPRRLKYTSLKSIACRLYVDYGCKYKFFHHDYKLYVTRLM